MIDDLPEEGGPFSVQRRTMQRTKEIRARAAPPPLLPTAVASKTLENMWAKIAGETGLEPARLTPVDTDRKSVV